MDVQACRGLLGESRALAGKRYLIIDCDTWYTQQLRRRMKEGGTETIRGSDGKSLIAAIVAGYEVQIRLSLALDPAALAAPVAEPERVRGAIRSFD
jgi:hypothetical protein